MVMEGGKGALCEGEVS